MGSYFEDPVLCPRSFPESLALNEPPPLTIDQLVRRRASVYGDGKILAYPSSGTKYVDYTARQIDLYAYHAALHYARILPQRSASSEKPRVVGLLGPSNLDYVISMFALSKLGHTVMFLSPKMCPKAYHQLFDKTGALDLMFDESFRERADLLQKQQAGLRIHTILTHDVYSHSLAIAPDTRMDYRFDQTVETNHCAWIVHSSGSTSFPKPVYLTHHAALSDYRLNFFPGTGFITMPLYYSHGISTLCKSFYSGKQVHLYNAALPLAKQYLVETLENHDFDIFHGVPYTLKIMAEDNHAIGLLVKCKTVMYAGSACPDALGDLLTQWGVRLVAQYGLTETGQLMTSQRTMEDDLWSFLRPSAKSEAFLRFEKREAELWELICLDGWPGKTMTNREDGSYATRDLFIKHPAINAYKYFSRLDDTITLVTGEKVNPLLSEGIVRQNSEVKDAIVFGVAKPRLGLLIFPSTTGAELSRETLLDRIWPSMEKGQETMPKYARLSRSMVKVMSPDAECSCTHKGTIIRQDIYRRYASVINAIYDEKEEPEMDAMLSGHELEAFIAHQVQDILGRDTLPPIDADFFQLGMDSLGAIQLREAIVTGLYTAGDQLGCNIAFDFPSIRSLSSRLEQIRAGGAPPSPPPTENQMADLISKYSTFPHPSALRNGPIKHAEGGHHVLVTGATGSLGAHMVSILVKDTKVKTVYCLVRASSPQHARERVLQSLRNRHVLSTLTARQVAKIVALPSDHTQPNLGLSPHMYGVIKNNLTVLIHAAWAVNFNLGLGSFAQTCIPQTYQLITLCLCSSRRASFNFCSSISAASAASNMPSAIIPETLPSSLAAAEATGYAQSKLVAEHFTMAAAAAASSSETAGQALTARVLRLGQLCGDETHGVWNKNEAVPLMVRSAGQTGVLPMLEERVRWLSVDAAARTVVELALPETVPGGVYNVVALRDMHWTGDVLPLLREAGVVFEEVAPVEWIARVRASGSGPVVNPAYRLVEFFERKYGGEGKVLGSVGWETKKTEEYSRSFCQARVVDRESLGRMVRYWSECYWDVVKG